jgi:hypothetical protein
MSKVPQRAPFLAGIDSPRTRPRSAEEPVTLSRCLRARTKAGRGGSKASHGSERSAPRARTSVRSALSSLWSTRSSRTARGGSFPTRASGLHPVYGPWRRQVLLCRPPGRLRRPRRRCRLGGAAGEEQCCSPDSSSPSVRFPAASSPESGTHLQEPLSAFGPGLRPEPVPTGQRSPCVSRRALPTRRPSGLRRSRPSGPLASRGLRMSLE